VVGQPIENRADEIPVRIEHAASAACLDVVENEMEQEGGFPHARKAGDVEPQLSTTGDVGEQGPTLRAFRPEERSRLEWCEPFGPWASSRIQAQMRPGTREGEFLAVG